MGWLNKNPYYSASIWRRVVIVALVVLTVSAVFVSGVALGLNRAGDARAASLNTYLKIGDRGAPRGINDTVQFTQFWQIWDYLKSQSYFAKELTDLNLFYGAEAGLVAAIGDPYSVFFPPEQAREFSQELAGKFQGIGAEIGMKNNALTIIAPLPSSPAEKAGLRTGDVVAEIDRVDTSGMAIDVAIAKIRGTKGSVVTLKILRGSDLLSVPIERDIIIVPDTKLTFDGNTAVLKIYHFNEGVEQEFNKALTSVKQHGSINLILDLRGNPGGFLDAAVAVTSAWLEAGQPVVYEQRTNGDSAPYLSTKGDHLLAKLRTIVLVDGGSASAAEIVAGALQDYGKATLVGESTFGKGSVQTLWQLNDGSAVKLTIASWLTPKKRQINDKGITPDIIVAASKNEGEDSQLVKAKELLKR